MAAFGDNVRTAAERSLRYPVFIVINCRKRFNLSIIPYICDWAKVTHS